MFSSQQSLNIRKDTQAILAKQTASDAMVSKNFAKINSKIQKQEGDHTELLAHSRNIVSSVHSIEASSNQHKALASAATQQVALMNERLKRIDKSSSRLTQNMKKANIELHKLTSQVLQSSRQTQQAIATKVTEMKGIHAETTFSTSSVDMITRVIREEIRATITPLVEEAFNQKETHREKALRNLENFNDTITHDIGSAMSSHQTDEASNLDTSHSIYSDDSIANQKNRRACRTQCEPEVSQPFVLEQESAKLHHTVSVYKRKWSHKFNFGTLKIEITYTCHRVDGSPQSRNHTSVDVHFWPVQKYLSLPRISAFYSTAPTPGGYYQLAPTIAVYPIVAWDHPIFSVMTSRDLKALQKMLATGQIHPRSSTSTGSTLLHVSSLYSMQVKYIVFKATLVFFSHTLFPDPNNST